MRQPLWWRKLHLRKLSLEWIMAWSGWAGVRGNFVRNQSRPPAFEQLVLSQPYVTASQ